MIFEGTFKNYNNTKTYYVKIGNTGAIKTIQDNTDTTQSNKIVCFAPTPVILSTDISDTFENVFIQSCTISLVANYNISKDVTANNYTDIPVEIRLTNNNGMVIFKGYVEPLSFNQSYSNTWNQIDLNCVDLLGITEYIKFPTLLNSNYVDYMTPRDIIDLIFENGLNTTVSISASYNLLKTTTYINPSLFIGASKDDWKTCKEVLSTIGKTYGIWWIQVDQTINEVDFWLFKLNTRPIYTFTKNDFMSNDANLSMSEAYNQIRLTCNIESTDQTLVDPFDDDMMVPKWSTLYEYMNEIVCPGEGERAINAFKSMVRDRTTLVDYDPALKYRHFCQVYENPLWSFGTPSYATQSSPYQTLSWMHSNSGSAGFFGFGRSENVNNLKNTESIHSVDLTKYFMINVDGHQRESENTMEQQIQSNSPLCSVTYNQTQNFVPNDRDTTNYIVISGKILLQPIVPKTGSQPALWGTNDWDHYSKSLNTVQTCIDGWSQQAIVGPTSSQNTMWHRTIPHPDNSDGAYYQQIFTEGDNIQTITGPIENEKLKKYQYKYSYHGQRRDEIDKVSVIACRLKIGDKYCVERIDQADGMNTFEWLTQSELPVVDGATIDFFTIGFNPKIDDYIVGTSFDICDTRELEMGLSTKGTCIPITFDDHLNGQMTFEILGPYNLVWSDNDRVTHGWWFWKSTKNVSTDVLILEQIQSIFLSNFKISMESDNGNASSNEKNGVDLVYASSSNVMYIEDKEYDTDICTSLTSQEAASLGIDYKITNNNILTKENNEFVPFYGFDYYIDDTHHYGTKLEEARVYEQYQYWKKPREVVEVTVKLNNEEMIPYNYNFKFSSNWDFPNDALFRCIGKEEDLKYDSVKLTLKNTN